MKSPVCTRAACCNTLQNGHDRKLTEPCKVYSNLLPEVRPDVIERLILVPHAPSCPVLKQHLARIQLIRLHVIVVGFLVWALKPWQI